MQYGSCCNTLWETCAVVSDGKQQQPREEEAVKHKRLENQCIPLGLFA